MPVQTSNSLGRSLALAAFAVLGLTTILSAHEGDMAVLLDKQVPYPGRGWTANSGGGGAPDIDFPSSGVELLSWLPISQFGAQNNSASTCEGYVSPGGHEYAIIGVSGGTGFVDVTDPGNAQ